MGLFDFFSKKTPEQIQENGDRLFEKKAFGQAKIEYEKALEQHTKSPVPTPSFEALIRGKIAKAREALAAQHQTRGEELMELGCIQEAKEILTLALELTETEAVKEKIKALLLNTTDQNQNNEESAPPSIEEIPRDEPEEEPGELDDESVDAVMNTLPGELRDAYLSYGDDFIAGYMQMNQGNFKKAVKYLERAMAVQETSKNFIPLELATCHLNLDNNEAARDLLMDFLKDFPESGQGYELICEGLWALSAFDHAHHLLSKASDSFTASPLFAILWGETLAKSGKLKEAEEWYTKALETHKRDNNILLHLATTVDALGDYQKAARLYRELMNICVGCGTRPDPFLKQSYADACLKSGEATTQLLDVYFDLVGEFPDSRGEFYEKISSIYGAMGEEKEAQRFGAQAMKLKH